MRSIAVAPLDRFVGDEPRIAAAANAVRGGAPPSDVRLILIRHAERESIEARVAERREMKDELVAVVQEAVAVDWLVMPDRQIARQSRGSARRRAVDRDRLDPMDDVLQPEMRPHGLRDVE